MNRTDAVLAAVKVQWRDTTQIDLSLWDSGFKWTTETTRGTLHHLAEAGRIERRKSGRTYQWRLIAAPAPVALTDAEAILGELRGVIERAQRPEPEPSPAAAQTVVVGDDVDLPDLVEADAYIVERIVKRAAYDALRAMLTVLDGWIEGNLANVDAGVGRADQAEQFHADDIRCMANDAARLMGTREPHRPAADNG